MNAPLWTWAEVVAALGGEVLGTPPEGFSSVSFDSREIAGGELFFAIRGVRMDGHAFAAAALRAGAAMAVVSHADEEMKATGPLLVVEEPLQALRRLAVAARERVKGRVIGVTGSVGKTTTKEMLALAFSSVGRVHAAKASFNNHWGVPLTLARMPREADFAIVEMGMNAPGEIADLASLTRPDVAVVTAVAESHIGAFGDLSGIARAKAEVFSGLAPGGAAVINLDAPHADILLEAARAGGAETIFTYGRSGEADIRLQRAVNGEDCVCVEAWAGGGQLAFRIGMPGEHIALNALAVVGCGLATGADMTALLHALSGMRPAPGRGGRYRLALPGGEALLIDESYNANPASMRAALASLAAARPGPGGRRLAVLGDMLELGEQAPRLHAALAAEAEAAKVDALYLCGPLMRHLGEAAPRWMRAAWAETSRELQDIVLGDVRPGDVIMVKGSAGSRMGPLAEALRRTFEPEAQEA